MKVPQCDKKIKMAILFIFFMHFSITFQSQKTRKLQIRKKTAKIHSKQRSLFERKLSFQNEIKLIEKLKKALKKQKLRKQRQKHPKIGDFSLNAISSIDDLMKKYEKRMKVKKSPNFEPDHPILFESGRKNAKQALRKIQKVMILKKMTPQFTNKNYKRLIKAKKQNQNKQLWQKSKTNHNSFNFISGLFRKKNDFPIRQQTKLERVKNELIINKKMAKKVKHELKEDYKESEEALAQIFGPSKTSLKEQTLNAQTTQFEPKNTLFRFRNGRISKVSELEKNNMWFQKKKQLLPRINLDFPIFERSNSEKLATRIKTKLSKQQQLHGTDDIFKNKKLGLFQTDFVENVENGGQEVFPYLGRYKANSQKFDQNRFKPSLKLLVERRNQKNKSLKRFQKHNTKDTYLEELKKLRRTIHESQSLINLKKDSNNELLV